MGKLVRNPLFPYRATTSTQLEDRRDALRGIRALSKKYPSDVGMLCMEVLIGAIKADRSDNEIVSYAVESLWNTMDSHQSPELDATTAVEFTKQFTTTPEHVTMLLDLLEEFDFQVRRPTTCLLTTMLKNKLAEVQETVLVSPMGISRIMDLLSDSREVVRNDGLLLLLQLTRSNRQIQKIVAFDNAFDRLLGIVRVEGWSDGGIVVEDCLLIIRNLLKGNNSNQNFFREASLLPLLVPFFQFPSPPVQNESFWYQQKVTNVLYMLQVLRTLVSPSNPLQATSACQKSILLCGLLKLLCEFMFASGVPTEILVETISTVAEVIRGCSTNQKFFETVTPHTNPPRSANLALLMSMVTEKQPLPLRLAALYCFQSYVYHNEEGQAQIIDTLLPSTSSSTTQPQITAGQVLCAGLFGNDPFSNWSTATAIACSLNASLKPQLLRVQLSMSGRGQVTLLQQVTTLLSEKPDLAVQTKIGLLILLCSWLADCNIAVAQFLNDSSHILYLTGQLEQHYTTEMEQLVRELCAVLLGICLAFHDGSSTTYTLETLHQIINHRVGRDAFTQCLTHISSSEFFTSANKSPQLLAESLEEICFDYSFTVLFKHLAEVIPRALDSSTPQPIQNGQDPNASTTIEDHDSIVSQYKELIRSLDEELSALKQRHAALEASSSQDSGVIEQQSMELQILREQLATVKGAGAEVVGEGEGKGREDAAQLQSTIMVLQRMQEAQRQELASKSVKVEQLQQSLEAARSNQEAARGAREGEEVARLKEEVLQLKAENEALLSEKDSLDSQLKTLQDQQGRETLPQTLTTSEPSVEVTELQQQLTQLKGAYQEVQSRNATMEKELEDLLVLLADHDARSAKFKNLLVENKIPLPPEEEEEEEEDEEDGEEEEEGGGSEED